jgi:hypothetical protein
VLFHVALLSQFELDLLRFNTSCHIRFLTQEQRKCFEGMGRVASLSLSRIRSIGDAVEAGKMPATLTRVRKVYGERAQVMADALKRELGDAVTFTHPTADCPSGPD